LILIANLRTVINSRSFGEDQVNVTRKAMAYTCGLQDNRVLAVGKHFPGHGDTQTDSHFALPLVDHDKEKLNQIDLFPFRLLTEHGIGGIMVAHLAVPALEPDQKLPASLSKAVVDSLLVQSMDFKGLIFTDALNMKGVADGFKPGEIELKALMAGNDVLLFPQDVERAVNRIAQAVADSLISEELINHHCLKVLKAKKWAGLNHYQAIDTANLVSDLHTPHALDMNRELTEKSLTLVQSSKNPVIPVEKLEGMRILSICIGNNPKQDFQSALNLYGQVDTINITGNLDDVAKQTIIEEINRHNSFCTHYRYQRGSKTKFWRSSGGACIYRSNSSIKTLFVGHFGNPYALRTLNNSNH
jgi:beta-glucosidase-like glycosyl hydrolase